MSTCACQRKEELKDHSTASIHKRRKGGIIGWGLPGLGLLFIPKCPLCLAAYVSMFSGLSLTFSQAKYIRYGIIFLCSVSALLFVLHVAKTYRERKRQLTQLTELTQST